MIKVSYQVIKLYNPIANILSINHWSAYDNFFYLPSLLSQFLIDHLDSIIEVHFCTLSLKEVDDEVLGHPINPGVVLFVFQEIKSMKLVDIINSQDYIQFWRRLR